MGLSVGVLVLVSTANWQGTQPHSTRFTSAHSIEFDLVNFILYNLGRGWAGISGPPPVGLPVRQKAKGAAALEVWAGVEWGVLAALGA